MMTHFQGSMLLIIAIMAEVVGTSFLKLSDGYSNLIPTVVALSSYGVAMYTLSHSFRVIPVGIAYAIWTGIGSIAITAIGYFVFRQVLSPLAMAGIVLIVAGVVLVNLCSKELKT